MILVTITIVVIRTLFMDIVATRSYSAFIVIIRASFASLHQKLASLQ